MAKVLDLKLQLQTAKKGASNCAQFLQQMQSLTDRLRSIGTDITDADLILYVAQGLGTDYESFITALSMRPTPPTMVEFSSLLLTHKARILHNLKSSSLNTVHLTTQSNGSDYNSALYANTYRSNQPPSRGRSNQYKGRSNNRGRGRGRSSGNQESIQCQICQKWGHSALRCYHRFDIRYASNPVHSNADNSGMVTENPSQVNH